MNNRMLAAFGAGVSLSTLWFHRHDERLTPHLWLPGTIKPMKAATVLNPASPSNESRADIVPLNADNSKLTQALVTSGAVIVDDSSVTMIPSFSGQSRVREIMKHGYPSLDGLRVFDDYVLSYDRRNRVANWVFEHLTREQLRPAAEVDRGKSEFQEDPHVHPYFRSTNRDFKASGYDRGHMAAAANHRTNQRLLDDTFYLSNMAPQVGVGFNRDKWNDLEKEVRSMVRRYDNVWVCTGPLYLPRLDPADKKMYVKYEVIGTQHVAVPTHFFKVCLCELNGVYSLFSYVLPNKPCDNATPLSSYLVPIDSIERAAGFLFFDKLPRSSIKYLNNK